MTVYFFFFKGLKNVIGQATTLNSDTADDDLESGIETGTSNETRQESLKVKLTTFWYIKNNILL